MRNVRELSPVQYRREIIILQLCTLCTHTRTHRSASCLSVRNKKKCNETERTCFGVCTHIATVVSASCTRARDGLKRKVNASQNVNIQTHTESELECDALSSFMYTLYSKNTQSNKRMYGMGVPSVFRVVSHPRSFANEVYNDGVKKSSTRLLLVPFKKTFSSFLTKRL